MDLYCDDMEIYSKVNLEDSLYVMTWYLIILFILQRFLN